MLNPYLGAYWSSRGESLESCSHRLLRCLTTVGVVIPELVCWYEKMDSRGPGNTAVILDSQVLGRLLNKGRNRRDSDLAIIEKLGYSASLWNGNPSFPFSLWVSCAVAAGPRLGNAFTLTLPNTRPFSEWIDWPQARELLMAVVEAWDPEWASLTTHEWREVQDPPPGTPIAGWVTYLSGRKNRKAPPPAVIVEPLGESSVVYVAATNSDPFLSQSVLELGRFLTPPQRRTRLM
ncbi:MAG: Imm52 family immunity protein [Acidimicrobiales bacterium]